MFCLYKRQNYWCNILQENYVENFSETMETEALRTFITIYSDLFRCEWLRSNIGLVLHKETIRSVVTQTARRWNLRDALTVWNRSGCKTKYFTRLTFSKAPTDPWSICRFQNFVRVWLHQKIMLAVSKIVQNWKMTIFTTLNKVISKAQCRVTRIENFMLTVGRFTSVQAIRLPLYMV